MCGGQRSTSDVFLSFCLPLFFETACLIELEDGLWDQTVGAGVPGIVSLLLQCIF